MIKTPITNELSIRILFREDSAIFFDLIDRNRGRLKDYFPITTGQIVDQEACNAYMEEKLHEIYLRKFYCFVLEDTEVTLQGLFFLKNVDWRVPKCEIAYFIDGSYAGKGIMTKALKLVINYCFETLGFNKLYITSMLDNIASRRLAEKCGFQLEGTLKKDFRLASGELVDDVIYGLVNPCI